MSCNACLRHIRSYAAASMHLHLAAWHDGGDGVLRDVSVSLCEDFKTVMVYATHKDGHDVYASFELPQAVSEAEFDYGFWLALFGADADQEAGGKAECCCCCC